MPPRDASRVPVGTYRVQLNGKFTFQDLQNRAPFLRELGISDLYLSPIFASTPGSLHGYDVSDYRKINEELGGQEAFNQLTDELHAKQMGVVLDFVPNHMGIAGPLNLWWRDVLEGGQQSPYAPFFDIQWKSGAVGERPRVLVPLLADHYGKELEDGKISVAYAKELTICYGDVAMPVNPMSYSHLLEPLGRDAGSPEAQREMEELIAAFASLPQPAAAQDPAAARERSATVEQLKRRLDEIVENQPTVRERLAIRLKAINGTPGDARSFEKLHRLLEEQHYRLARWKTGAHEINYRRFFAIDSLVGLHMERMEVFRESHELLGQLVKEGRVSGLRIDHIDGLRQPEDYLQRLQSLEHPEPSKPLYVLVEKILAQQEELPAAWPVHGTTGYEFIPQLAAVLVDTSAETKFDEIYRRFTGEAQSYLDTVYEKKRMIIAELFANAVSNLGAELSEIVGEDRRWRDLTRHELTTAVSELMANLPVYRTYRRREEPVSEQDRAVLAEACAQAIARNPRAEPQPFQFVRDVLNGSYPKADCREIYRRHLLGWAFTFQQYTGAVMAKAVEDTTFYTYCRFIALNEVGGDPATFGGSVAAFHKNNRRRFATAPHSMLTTSTHDTKFSEDVRARLYALSELPEDWESWVGIWKQLNARHISTIAGRDAPDTVDEYRFYQILLGAWPLEAGELNDAFRQRLREHFRKAVNEAKRHTSWLHPNEGYLAACDRFVDGVTTPELARDFLAAFVPCAQRIARIGMVNSLTQVVLKCTVPGVPDFYQGCEIWDFSLVDPDNRREVDYRKREELLERCAARSTIELLRNWRDGGVKLCVARTLMKFRLQHPLLFSAGDYSAIAATGGFADHVVAFTRTLGDKSILVAVPRLTSRLGSPPLGLVWDDTCLPESKDGLAWRDLFTGQVFRANAPLFAHALFAYLPFAVLENMPRSESQPTP